MSVYLSATGAHGVSVSVCDGGSSQLTLRLTPGHGAISRSSRSTMSRRRRTRWPARTEYAALSRHYCHHVHSDTVTVCATAPLSHCMCVVASSEPTAGGGGLIIIDRVAASDHSGTAVTAVLLLYLSMPTVMAAVISALPVFLHDPVALSDAA